MTSPIHNAQRYAAICALRYTLRLSKRKGVHSAEITSTLRGLLLNYLNKLSVDLVSKNVIDKPTFLAYFQTFVTTRPLDMLAMATLVDQTTVEAVHLIQNHVRIKRDIRAQLAVRP